MLKRIFDFTLAFAGLFISLPLLCILALAIWIEDKGSVFYFQERVGKAGRLFYGVKLRSMMLGAEDSTGPVQSGVDDLRVTRLGRILRRTALDELPQLWNILKGQMSFVGPRALRPIECDGPEHKLKRIEEFEGFSERCSVTPGLTGVAQVLAPRDVSRAVKFQYDIWYVRNRSFRLDMELVILSFLITFAGKWEVRGRRFKHLTDKLNRRIEQA